MDAAIAHEILRVVEPMAIEASMEAERKRTEGLRERQRVAELDLQQARYEASLAERRYAACDPDNRLIAAELENSWETTLRRVQECEARLEAMRLPEPGAVIPDLTGLESHLERTRREHTRPPAARSRTDRRHCRRCRRRSTRGCPYDPLAGRPALPTTGPETEVRRARMPDLGRGTGGDTKHGW